MTTEVSAQRIQIATDFGMQNADTIASVCREADIPFAVACALFQKESMGRNTYGRDLGGALSGFTDAVSKDNFAVFFWLVCTKGGTANGVGPSQVTYAGSLNPDGTRDGGHFKVMSDQGLKPWNVHDNMLYGLRLLKADFDATGSWAEAGTKYNGARSYGEDLVVKIEQWRQRLTQ